MAGNIKVVPESALRFDIKFQTDIEVIGALIILYCQRRVFLKTLNKVPRPKLIEMLVMYIKYGYNMESKEKLRIMFGETDMTNINSWNRELRSQGFIHKDTFNENLSHLNEDLQIVKTYYEKAKGKLDIKVMFTLKE